MPRDRAQLLHGLWDAFRQQFTPRFHELSAFLIAVSCGWLILFNDPFRQGLIFFFTGFGSGSPLFLAVGCIAAIGGMLSLVHGLIARQRSARESALMGWFVMGTSGVASFFAGIDLLHSRYAGVLPLAVWNISMSIIQGFQMGGQKVEIAGVDASPRELFIATSILLAILSTLELFLDLPWSVTLSIGIFYATGIVFLGNWLAARFNWDLGRETHDRPEGS